MNGVEGMISLVFFVLLFWVTWVSDRWVMWAVEMERGFKVWLAHSYFYRTTEIKAYQDDKRVCYETHPL